MKPEFQDLAIDCWQHTGTGPGTTKPCYCLYHDHLELGAPIVQALDELAQETAPARRALSLRPSSRDQSITTIRLRLVSPRDNLRVMHFASAAGVLTIELTASGLPVLRNAVALWLKGAEDFGVSAGHARLKKSELGELDRSSGEIWFWGPYYYAP